MWGLWGHETAIGFGNYLLRILTQHLAFHERKTTFALQTPAFELYRHTNRQLRAIADVGFRREALYSLQPQPVRHDIIQQAENNAAMNDVTIADVPGIGRKLRAADFTIKPEAQIETDGIGRSTNETAIRFTLQSHTPVLIIRGDTSRYDI